jgi:S-adenosylmethionine:tRNA ribosyltransferase-isomerase
MLRTEFHYVLPRELIAQEPRPRGRSRMLVVGPVDGPPRLRHETFAAFPRHLRRGDVLVLNDTAVFPARLFAEPKGAMKRRIEILLVRRLSALRWAAWCRPARRIREGDVLRFSEELRAEVAEKRADGTVVVDFSGSVAGEPEFWEAVDAVGVPPLPPYIERAETHAGDREAYQTVYAEKKGAVAAPTAGLHFTPEILAEAEEKGVEVVRLTLHVGIGTFKPVTAERVADHLMESEWYEIPPRAAAAIAGARRDGRRVVAVGTTAVRALESAAVAGEGEVAASSGETTLFITPGYRFRVVDALLTNFHLPESTLLMLVSAFAGRRTIRAAYDEAIRERYLFYSFGDCMLLTGRGGW